MPTSSKNNLMDHLSQSFIDQDAGVAPATNQKQIGCFDKWRRFLSENGFEDEWLTDYSQEQKTYLISAFAGACRRNLYGKTSKPQLRGKTVKATITNVQSTFRTNLQPDPALDPDQASTPLYLDVEFPDNYYVVLLKFSQESQYDAYSKAPC